MNFLFTKCLTLSVFGSYSPQQFRFSQVLKRCLYKWQALEPDCWAQILTHHRWVLWPWVDYLYNIPVYVLVCLYTEGNHSAYFTVVVRIKWINICKVLRIVPVMWKELRSCHPWSWWRQLNWLVGNWCSGMAKVGYRRYLQSHVCWFCFTAAAAASWSQLSFISQHLQSVSSQVCCPVWRPCGYCVLEMWLVWIETCCRYKTPTLNFKDLVKIKYFINSLFINYMLELWTFNILGWNLYC